MRPRARQIVETLVSNVSGHAFGDRTVQSVSFYMHEADYSNPEVFGLLVQEARKLPRTPAQQLLMRVINGAHSGQVRKRRRKTWHQ
jgi:hypothetical protein